MQKLSPTECIEKATLQYQSFRPYLAAYQITVSNSSNRAGAKDKLQRMSNQDFINMSIDIYDELQRRKENSPDIPFLPVNPQLPANKNGARQKLATLAVSRFHLLCSDVMNEIETRFPIVVQRYEDKFGSDRILSNEKIRKSPTQRYEDARSRPNDYSAPQTKSFTPSPRQSSRQQASRQRSTDAALPSKNTSQRAGDRDVLRNGGANVNPNANKGSLDNLMSDLGNMMSFDNDTADQEPSWIKQKREYEAEISELKGQVSESMNMSLGKVADLETLVRTLKDEKNELELLVEKMSGEYAKLKDDHDWLVEDFENQKLISNDIRAEASNLLVEIKNLSKENDDLIEENRRLNQDLDSNYRGGDGVGMSKTLPSSQPQSQPAQQPNSSSSRLIISKARIDAFQQAMSDFLTCAK